MLDLDLLQRTLCYLEKFQSCTKCSKALTAKERRNLTILQEEIAACVVNELEDINEEWEEDNLNDEKMNLSNEENWSEITQELEPDTHLVVILKDEDLQESSEQFVPFINYENQTIAAEIKTTEMIPVTDRSQSVVNDDTSGLEVATREYNKSVSSLQDPTWNNTTCHVCGKSFEFYCRLKKHMTTHNADKSFKCLICSSEFSYLATLKRHLKDAHNIDATHLKQSKKKHICRVCGKIFKHNCNLKQHMARHTGVEAYKCQHCSSTFRYAGSLNRHLAEYHSPDSESKCDKCGRQFKTEKQYLNHMKKFENINCLSILKNQERKKIVLKKRKKGVGEELESGEKPAKKQVIDDIGEPPYLCDICAQVFKYKDIFLNHGCLKNSVVKKSIETHPIKCEICDRGFKLPCRLRVHMRTHTKEKLFFCDVCNRGFGKKFTLMQHKTTHTGVRAHACEICGKRFTAPFSLVRHMKLHTGEGMYTCDVCGRKFASKWWFNFHKQSHSGVNFQCEFCPRSFALQSSFKTHLAKHTGEKTRKCKICGDLFASTSKLQDHLYLHDTEPDKLPPIATEYVRSHHCDNCDQSFSFKSSLNLHLLRFHNFRYECNVCGKTFQQKHNLSLHVNVHTGEKPFVCDVCNKTFSTPMSRDSHVKSVHLKLKPFECSICLKKFTRRGGYMRHRKNIHPFKEGEVYFLLK